MSVLSLFNAPPRPKVKRPRPEPRPEPTTLPKFNPIPNRAKFVHPEIRPEPTPEGRGPKVVPAACEYNTPDMPMDAIGCQARPGVKYVFVEGSGYQLAEPTPVIERPSKAEYIRDFQVAYRAAGRRLPACVLAHWFSINDLVGPYKTDRANMPRRARKALDQHFFSDLSCAYDTGLIARIAWYCERHNQRAYASKYLFDVIANPPAPNAIPPVVRPMSP